MTPDPMVRCLATKAVWLPPGSSTVPYPTVRICTTDGETRRTRLSEELLNSRRRSADSLRCCVPAFAPTLKGKRVTQSRPIAVGHGGLDRSTHSLRIVWLFLRLTANHGTTALAPLGERVSREGGRVRGSVSKARVGQTLPLQSAPWSS